MSDNTIKEVEKAFNITNIKTAIIGGTFISLDPGVGSPANLSSNGPNSVVTMDTQQHVNLYAELNELEKFP